MMQMAFYKHKGTWSDRLVRLFTGSDYSHVELVINGTACSSSARDGGVRFKNLDLTTGRWDVVQIDGDEGNAWEWFTEHMGQAYDYAGVFRFILPLLPHKADQWFCSEAVAAALGLNEPQLWTPAMLAEKYAR